MNNMFKTIFNPLNWKFWIFISISISFLHLSISLFHHDLPYDKPFLKTGDSFDYIASSNSYIINKEFVFFKTTEWEDRTSLIDQKEFDKSLYYAYRSPGYAFILIPLLKVFYYNTALKYIVILQVVFYGIAVYLLSLITLNLFNKRKVFYIIFLLLSISLGSSYWNVFIYTESFAISFLIFSVFTLFIGLQRKSYFLFFLSGLFITESILLRPFLAPILLVHTYLIIREYGFKKSILTLIIYLIPFTLIDGGWTIRNFVKTKELIPLAATTKYHRYRNKAFLKQADTYITIGIPFSFNAWFFNNDTLKSPVNIYPEKLFTIKNTPNEMLNAKKFYIRSLDRTISRGERAMFESRSLKIQTAFLEDFKDENKFTFLTSRLNTLGVLLNQGPIDLLQIDSKLNDTLNYSQKILNNFIYYFGLIATIIALYRFRKNLKILGLIFIPLFLLSFFSLINLAETREMFIPSFFMLIFAVELMSSLFEKKKWIYIMGIITFIILF